jgi:hypothetical protein
MKAFRIAALALCLNAPFIHSNNYEQKLCYELGALTALQAAGTIGYIAYNRYYKKNDTPSRALTVLAAATTLISAGLTGGVCSK